MLHVLICAVLIPQGFCSAFKDRSGNPVNISVQMDAQSFLLHLTEQLEELTARTNQPRLLQVRGLLCSYDVQC